MNLYDLLEVDLTASADEIRHQFKRLAMHYHPDRPSGDVDKFKAIHHAYETLSNEEARRQYNNSIRASFTFTSFSHDDDEYDDEDEDDDVFDTPRRKHQSYRRMSRNKDITLNITLDLIDVLHGKEVTCKLTFANGIENNVQLTIPPGVANGDVIRFPEIGDNTLVGTARGDIVATIIEYANDSFERDNENVYTRHWISAFAAMIGEKTVIENFDGTQLELNIPAGTQHGEIITIANKGLPIKNMGVRGDLNVNVLIYIPTEIEPKDIKALRKLEEKYKLN